MISAFTNIFKIPELRQRVLFVLAMIVIVRAGSVISAPGINAEVLRQWFINVADAQTGGGVAALFNLFSGGALGNCAIFALGIMPFISASIMMQLMTAVIPRLGRLSREDGGRQKISQYTRYVTIILCLFQGYLLALSFESPESNPFLPGIMDTINRLGVPLVSDPGLGFRLLTVITLTAGTMFLVWLGDQITERGIGNGISIIITVGILAQLPAGLIQAWRTFVPTGGEAAPVSPVVLVLLIAFLIIVIAAVIAVTQATRRISVQYAKRVVGRKVYGGQTQYMPLKVNYAGVMPIIFASSLMIFPSTFFGWLATRASQAGDGGWWAATCEWFANNFQIGAYPYIVVEILMIYFFSYFWTTVQFSPDDMSRQLKENGSFIPGLRPGPRTAEYLETVMERITFVGAGFLAIIAIIPTMVAEKMNIPFFVSSFLGGTGLLIVVSVGLDLIQRIEANLLMRNYSGFLGGGDGRGPRVRSARG